MKNEFKPTKSMANAAKKGLEMANNFIPVEGGDTGPGTPRALEVGRKIASGQNLSTEHMTDMAHFHASHDKCPQDCEDLLWGGPAGETWAKSNLMKSLNTGFSEDLNELLKDKETDLSFEIFSDANLEEPVSLGEDDKGLIWAPILRSGMLLTRPGPNGEKLDEPLVFVKGHSQNQMKEIGLEDVVDAYKDGAIEHVTIPKTHANDTFENTGFIKDLIIVDSKRFPGEKVILAGHDFKDPEAKEKVDLGTVASRSSGLLYDYKNTTTGKIYPVALEHVALTNKPWVGGLAPYGSENDIDFSDRTIVPMMLSEKPIPAISPEKTEPTKLAQETNKKPVKSTKEGLKSEFLADVQWGENLSYRDIEKQVGSILDKFTGDEDSYPQYYVIDITDGKALVKVNYGIGSDNDAWVVPYTVNDKQIVELSPFSDWIDVAKKWVNDTIDPVEDKEQLDKLKMSEEEKTNLAVLNAKDRKKLPDSAFVYPSEEKYPIADLAHARNALARVAQNGSPEEQSKVRAAVYKRYPELKKNKEKTNMAEPLKVASDKRQNHEPPGGHMTLLMSEEQMDRLGLSDEAREVIQKQNEETAKLQIKLSENEKVQKADKVKTRMTELSETFKAWPAFLKEIEKTYLSDDGDIALKLTLSESGHDISAPETATQIVDRLLAAIPAEVKLSDQASRLLDDPLKRPPVDLAEKEKQELKEGKGPKTGDELLAEMATADPSLANEPMFKEALLSENGKGK